MGFTYMQNERIIDIADRFVKAFETLVYSRTENAKSGILSDDNVEKIGAKKNTDLPDIQGAYNKFSNDMIKQIEKIQDDRINEILTDIFGGE